MDLKVQLCSCLFCAVLLAAIPSSENFDINSSPTITGIVGQDVVLPCQISTRTQPDNMEVQWKKIIQSRIEIVHEYRAQTDQDVPGQKYQGRTALLKDGFTSGNVSLKLKNVQLADGGTYSCIVKSNEWSADAATELRIAAVASVAIDVVGPQDQGIKLACRSTGWFPKPELHWTTKNGQDLQPVTQTEQDRELLFNVLSHVTVLGKETGEISCVIRNSLLKTEQKSVILLSGDIFPHVSPWLAAFWVLFTLNLLAIGACAILRYKAKQKVSKKKSSEETLFLKETEWKALELGGKEKHNETELQILRSQVETLEEEKEQLGKEKEKLAGENGGLQGQIKTLAGENDQLRKDKEKLAGENGGLQGQINQLKNEKKKLVDEYDQLKTEKEKLVEDYDELQVELKWKSAHKYADDIILNADTAHPNLSTDGKMKSFTHEVQPQKVKQNPERFDSTVCVLGSKGFSSGKHYWEVEVENSTDWDLGVARKSIERKGKLSLSPKEGFWVLGLSGRDYWAKTDPWTRVLVKKKPKKIGVYFSYEDKEVAFFNVTNIAVLFTFNDCSFSGEVYPFFKNSHKETTMKICSVRKDERV